MFCMNCGQQLPDDAKFCLKCGTPLGQTSSEVKTAPQSINLDGSNTFVPAMCPNCNAHMKVDSSSKTALCESCGTECLVQDAIKALNVRGNVHVGNATININGTNTESLLQRVEIMLADGDFDGAMKKCDAILDSDPKNGMVYLYMLMASLKCQHRVDLANQSVPYDQNQYYIKAIKYGDNNLKNELIGNLEIINNRAREEEAEYIRHENQIRNLRAGEVFYLGTINGNRIWWIVLKINQRKALVISRDCISKLPYHLPGGAIIWQRSTIRDWLNTVFLDRSFAPNERAKILRYNGTGDLVVLLSAFEANYYFPEKQMRSIGSSWWLRGEGKYSSFGTYVSSDGTIHEYQDRDGYVDTDSIGGVRPAMWISID